jgi:hypothetical protein
MKSEIRFLSWVIGLRVEAIVTKAPNLYTYGITNETSDGYYVPFMDYDNILFQKVERDIIHLQKVFGLGTAVVLETSSRVSPNEQEVGNYLVVFFDKLPYQKIFEVLEHTVCDVNYRRRNRGFPQKNWVIRVAEKVNIKSGEVTKRSPRFKCTMNAPTDYIQSDAHRMFLQKLFNCDIELQNLDNFKSLDLINYVTRDV